MSKMHRETWFRVLWHEKRKRHAPAEQAGNVTTSRDEAATRVATLIEAGKIAWIESQEIITTGWTRE